ncbi:hypothetical protein BGX23_007988 [Mortierella sp. AD031]|nr:hypothetical protein BGX23_007988 [Mortierella sp. AD031]KAG0205791.1 hypothetical protein BGX33_007750 [Mortierella sp. NVP41]
MVFSTALVAIPAILYLGAPMTTVIFVPIAVGGVVGGALLLTGSLLILILPIVAIGGAAYFLFIAVPASMTVRELNQTIKRSKKDEFATALEALGPDWEIQPARPDEWFHWTFPKTTGSLDKISMRMAVFDPNDHSERKVNTFKWLDRIQDEVDGKEDENNVEVNIIRKKSSKGPSEIRNNSDTMWVENLSFVRENDHFVIEIEDNGANLLSHKWGKNYLELAKIVDRAATEMETADPSVKLGNQVVMVQKNRNDPFWQKFSILGDFALRIPVDRQWVHDVTDE